MTSTRKAFLLILVILTCWMFSGTVLPASSEVTAGEKVGEFPKTEYGVLRGLTFNPPFLQISKGNFIWEQGRTVFSDHEGRELTPQLFLKRFHGSHVQIMVDEAKFVLLIRPIYY